MSSNRIGALVGLTHCGVTLISATAFPNWYSYVGVPAVPLAVWLLEVWDPQWANFASPGTRWAFVLPVWGLNFSPRHGMGVREMAAGPPRVYPPELGRRLPRSSSPSITSSGWFDDRGRTSAFTGAGAHEAHRSTNTVAPAR